MTFYGRNMQLLYKQILFQYTEQLYWLYVLGYIGLLQHHVTSSVKIAITNFRNRRNLDFWILRMEEIGCFKTSVRNYHYSPRHNPEASSSLS